MNHSSKRWLSVWMMLCLLASMISLGYAEDAEIELTDGIEMGEDLQIEGGNDIDFIQDDGIEDQADLLLDLENGIELNGLHDELNEILSEEGVVLEELETNEAGDYNPSGYSNPSSFTKRSYSGKWFWPLGTGSTNVTSYVGGRTAPTAGASTNHHGTDISASSGSPVYAARDGYAVKMSSLFPNMAKGLGNWVAIDHGDGFYTAYGHMSSIANIFGSDSTANVKAGDVIGYVGMTGTATGPHLHFEIAYNWWGAGMTSRYGYTWGAVWGTNGWEIVDSSPASQTYVYTIDQMQPVTATTLQFTNVTYPKTFRINTSAGWALGGGTVESNYDLKTLKTQILNSSGNAISSATVSISGKSYAIRNLDTYSSNDNGVKFSYIKTAGSYKWVLTATDSNGRSLTLEMPFTAVSSGSTETSTAGIVYPEYSYKVLYKEYCAYKVVKAFNWHTGPSVYESTAGSASVGETFYTDTVVWNTTTNNMWVKKKGENKYVFAGLHWSDNKWYVDKTQTQYLEFVKDSSSAEWNGCNLSGTLPHGESFSLKGTLEANATMTYVWAEFYKNKSCWGGPTSNCEVNSTSFTMYNSQLDRSLKFGSLSSGDYELALHVYGISDRGQKQREYTITKPFSISEPKDTTAPTISNVEVSNVNSNGYTVTCTVSDNVGVTSVKFPTWTEANGQDDIIWHEGALSGSKASFTLNVRDHNNETGCQYITHIYAYDAAGNNTSTGVNVDVPTADTTAPTVSDLDATDISSEGFTAICTVSDNVGVTKVQFLVCVGNEPWEDGVWHDATISGNKATGRIRVSEHHRPRFPPPHTCRGTSSGPGLPPAGARPPLLPGLGEGRGRAAGRRRGRWGRGPRGGRGRSAREDG